MVVLGWFNRLLHEERGPWWGYGRCGEHEIERALSKLVTLEDLLTNAERGRLVGVDRGNP